MQQFILEKTVELGNSYFSRNDVRPEQIPEVLRSIAESLRGILDGPAAEVSGGVAPAAPLVRPTVAKEAKAAAVVRAADRSPRAEPEVSAPTDQVPASATVPAPAVPIDKSVTEDVIICLEDGKQLQMLTRYLKTHFNMTFEEYKRKWGLPDDYPTVSRAYARRRSELAKKGGFGSNIQPVRAGRNKAARA